MTLSVLNFTSAYLSPSQVHVSKASSETLKIRQLPNFHNAQERITKQAKVMHTSIDQLVFKNKETIQTSTSA